MSVRPNSAGDGTFVSTHAATSGIESTRTGPMSHPLHREDDHHFLNELFCFVRRHVEAFVVAPDDVAAHAVGKQPLGRVGVRCANCARASSGGLGDGRTSRPKGSVSFPKSIRLVYQCVRNMQRYHLVSCPAMPEEDKKEYAILKKAQERSTREAPKYWEECCRRVGMIDTPGGIRLRTGCFERWGPDSLLLDSGKDATLAPVSYGLRTELSVERCTDSIPTTSNGHEANSSLGIRPYRVISGGDETHFVSVDSAQKSEIISCHAAVSEQTMQMQKPIIPLERAANGASDNPNMDSDGFNGEVNVDELTELLYPSSLVPQTPLQMSQASSPSQTELLPERRNKENGSYGQFNDAVLEKVRLALDIVDAMEQIRQLPPPNGANENESHQMSHLASLGAELYEFFSGQSLNNETCEINSVDVDESSRRQKKKENWSNKSGYVPLSDHGLPPTVSSLVSSLLHSDRAGEHSDFRSMREVKDDLGLMVSKPETFLFHAMKEHLQLSPDNIYSREAETAKLLEAYDCVTDPFGTRTREMVLISGYSGTGKSALVETVRDRFIKKGACVISGKFDAMQHLQPLSAMVSAVDDYCGLLADNSIRIDAVKRAVDSAIGCEGRAVLESIIPSFAKVVTSRDNSVPVTQLEGREALQRVLFLIRTLFQATCSYADPVVLFLDDLQWADETSLLLMEVLMLDTMIEGLLFIGCYRENEVGADHPLMTHLAGIRRSGSINVTSVSIGNLDFKGVNSLLSESLHLTPHMTRSLAEVVLQKTGGNALFVKQFLETLHDDGLLYFSLSSRRWEWEASKISDKKIADDVVELMTAKLLKMAPEVLEALRVAAAFGAQCQEFIFNALESEPGKKVGSTVAALDVAVAEGIMNKDGSAYRFAHDQIQRAAYQLIPESEREWFHLSLGRMLWKCSSTVETENFLFVIVDQLFRGSSHITDHKEKIELARLSLLAGEMAVAMSAFLPASAYLNGGAGLLTDEDWHCHRELCFDLMNLLTNTEFILGNFDSMTPQLNCILSKSTTLQESLRAQHIRILSLAAQGCTVDAMNTASTVLSQLGEFLPVCSTENTVKQEIGLTMNAISSHTVESLLSLEAMEDIDKQNVMRFLHVLSVFSFFERKSLFPVLICRMLRLSLSHGVCAQSAFAFACYGMLLCGPLSRFSEAYQYGKIALNLVDRFQGNQYQTMVFVVVFGIINQAAEPIQAVLPPLKRAEEVGLATGDTSYTMLCTHVFEGVSFASGKRLDLLVEEMKMHSQRMVECKQNYFEVMSKPCRQAALNLLGRSADPLKLVGDEMDENNILDSVESGPHTLFLIDSYRMWLEYMFGQFSLAWQTAENNTDIGKNSIRSMYIVMCHNALFLGLTAIALARKGDVIKYEARIKETMTQMEVWAAAAPWNFQNKLELMKAEYAYLKGEFDLAAGHYQNAIDLSVKHHFVHEQALALERCGIYHLEMANHETASNLLSEARECYRQWGAQSKVAHIEQQISDVCV